MTDTTISDLAPTSEPVGARRHTEVVATLDDLAVGEMRLATVGERRVAVIRTASGVHALDNACPHQGYGLVTGALDGELVTCQWHNWKFRADTGECVMGEEDVACHRVEIVDGEVAVTVTEPTDEERRADLWPSLQRGIEANYVGQVARDVVRLLDAGADPGEIAWVGFAHALPREEWGPGHAMATAVDAAAWSAHATGDDDRALALVQGLAALAEPTRGRPARTVPEPVAADLVAVVEAEDADGARAAAVHLARTTDLDTARRAFVEAAAAHHLSYGHGIIYTQKAFELLERLGWQHAETVLPELALSTTWGTREDTLPYMRAAAAAIEAADLDGLAGTAPDATWSDPDLVDELLDATDAPIGRAVRALEAGAGVERLLDAVVAACSRRLLRYDLAVEFDRDDTFGWLDITHGLTTARAARWAWRVHPSGATVRQALFAVWLCFDTGRAERRHGVAAEPSVEARAGDIEALIEAGDVPAALAAVRGAGADAHGPLRRAALADGSGSFIVTAHLIKLTQAAIEEHDHSGSDLPLLAAARFLAAPRRERFVARNVRESLAFVRTGRPPRR